MEKQNLMLRDFVTVIAFIMIVGGAVAYAHTQFAYRDEVNEIRKMVFDLWKHQGLHLAKKK